MAAEIRMDPGVSEEGTTQTTAIVVLHPGPLPRCGEKGGWVPSVPPPC